jgi:hypothetical protein
MGEQRKLIDDDAVERAALALGLRLDSLENVGSATAGTPDWFLLVLAVCDAGPWSTSWDGPSYLRPCFFDKPVLASRRQGFGSCLGGGEAGRDVSDQTCPFVAILSHLPVNDLELRRNRGLRSESR